MPKLSWMVMIVLGAVTAAPASADDLRPLPAPRWQAPLASIYTQYPEQVQFKSVGPALLVTHYGTVIALNRGTGKELWRYSYTQETQPIDTAKPQSPPSSSPVGRSTRSEAQRRIDTSWYLTDGADIAPVGPVAFLVERRDVWDPDSTRANGMRMTSIVEDVAVKVMSGSTLWRTPNDGSGGIVTVLGSLLVSWPGAEEPKPGQAAPIRYRDALTGASIDASSAQGRAAIQHAAQSPGSGMALRASWNALYRLDAGAGTETCLHTASTYLMSYALYASQGRIVLHINADDDGAGHSVWPQYIVCTDLHGKKVWGFPAVLHYFGIEDPKTIPEPYSIASVAYCRAGGSVLCASDSAFIGRRAYLYGLDVRNGRLLWKRPLSSAPPALLEAGPGFLVTAAPRGAVTDRSHLVWINGRTGASRPIGEGPPIAKLIIDGDDLLLLDRSGNLLDYSLNLILHPGTPAAGAR